MIQSVLGKETPRAPPGHQENFDSVSDDCLMLFRLVAVTLNHQNCRASVSSASSARKKRLVLREKDNLVRSRQ